jgi:hypothetical protein
VYSCGVCVCVCVCVLTYPQDAPNANMYATTQRMPALPAAAEPLSNTIEERPAVQRLAAIPCEKRVSFCVLSLCLPRACLGKMINF